MSEPLYLCLRIGEFAAQALARLRPELRSEPLTVVDGSPPLETVCALNRRAAAAGVKKGMTRTELESFSQLRILHRLPAEEASARAALFAMAGAFTPRMEEHSDAMAFVLVLDVSGTQRMFGSPAALARRLLQAVRQMVYAVRVGVSANLMCAVCAARSARGPLVVVPRGQEAAFLAPLSLATLALTEQQAATFTMWGLRSLGELAALPEEASVARLGQEGRRLRRLARGEHPHLLVPMEPERNWSERMEFDSPVELLESLLFVLDRMLGQLILFAQNYALALASVVVRLELEGGGQHERRVRSALPSADRRVWLKLLQLDLQAHPPSAAVLAVRLEVEPGVRSKVQAGLFAPQTPGPMRLEVTLARIAALVGEERVGRVRLLDRHRPDSFAVEKFVVGSSLAAKKEPEGRAVVCLRRLRPPVQVQVLHRDSQPDVLQMRGMRYRVGKALGPWRQSGEWWSWEVWSQEEWDIDAQAERGDRLLGLLMHDLLHGVWTIVALYD